MDKLNAFMSEKNKNKNNNNNNNNNMDDVNEGNSYVQLRQDIMSYKWTDHT